MIWWIFAIIVLVSATGPPCSSVGVVCLAGRGIIHDSSLNLTEVIWVGPENKGIYVGSPSIFRLPTGPFVTSHDFFGKSTLNDTVQVLIDRSGKGDGGKWEYAGNVSGMYWANLFVMPNSSDLFLLGVSSGDHSKQRSIVISKSTDMGGTWTNPSVLFPFSDKIYYHCAPTPSLIASDGRIYRAFETNGHNGAMLISTIHPINASTDLLRPDVWQRSSILLFNESIIPSKWGPSKWGWEEGNAVESPDGTIYNIIRIDGQTTKGNNAAVVLRLDGSEMVFDKLINFPSCSSKFVIRRSHLGRYFTLSTDVTDQAISQGTVYARNHLVLAVSDDLFSWKICTVLLWDDTGFTSIDSARYTGFHYVDWVFDGEDIVYAIRTGYRGANSYHNANRMTVKRLSHYTAKCDWLNDYTVVGSGWCRPTDGWKDAGKMADDSNCASACTTSATCRSFTNDPTTHCALYPQKAETSSGSGSYNCYTQNAVNS